MSGQRGMQISAGRLLEADGGEALGMNKSSWLELDEGQWIKKEGP